MLKKVVKVLKYFFSKPEISGNKKAHPAVSWNEILKNSRPLVVQQVNNKPRKIQRKMSSSVQYPDRTLIIWRDDEKNLETSDAAVNFYLNFKYSDQTFLVLMRRPFDEPFVLSIDKLRLQILKKLAKAKLSKEELENAGNSLKIDYSFNIDSEVTCSQFATCSDADNTISINSEGYEIVKRRPPIASARLVLIPTVNSIIFPDIEYNSRLKTPPKLHWFIKNEATTNQSMENNQNKTKKSKHEKLNAEYIDDKNCGFFLPNFTYIKTSPFFIPSSDHLNHQIAVVIETAPGDPIIVASSMKPIENGPGKLITDEQIDYCRRKIDEPNVFRLMTYNILADLYLNLGLDQKKLFFSFCDKKYQEAHYRIPLILTQLRDFATNSVSLMFLQEVDEKYQRQYYRPFFEQLNFGFEFAKKMKQISEGVAIAFDLSKFQLISSTSYGIAELIENTEQLENVRRILNSSPESNDRMMTRPTIIQIVVLKEKLSKSIILCANTHLHHDPKDDYVKLLQAYVGIFKIFEIKKELEISEKKEIRIIFGGDFNSLPNGSVFQLLTEGQVDDNHDCWKLANQIKAEKLKIEQSFDCLTGTPEYTNYTKSGQSPKGFEGCLDYIWTINTTLKSRCPMPSHQNVIEFEALPSKTSPSDHLPSIVDIRI